MSLPLVPRFLLAPEFVLTLKPSLRKIHSCNLFCKKLILKNKTNKPCCCDDSCESVETTPNRFPAFTCSCDSPAPFCENSGKSACRALIGNFVPRFIHFLQQIPRIFFNSSPQDLMERSWRNK